MAQVRTFAAAAAAAGLLITVNSVVADGRAAMLQAATPCSPTGSAPMAPGGVQLYRSALTPDDVVAPFGPNAGGEAGLEMALAAAASHDYFDQLASRPDCQAAYSLRNDAEVAKYRYGNYLAKVSYDPVMDAAKWQWNYNDISAENIRLPIRLDRPASGTSKLLIISDHRWDSAWFTEYKDANGNHIGGWKWMQVTSGVGEGNPRQRIWFEPQMRSIGDNPFSRQTPPVLFLVSAREYLGAVAPTTGGDDAPVVCGINYGGDTLGPMHNCFKGYPNTWTRTWIELKATAGQNYTEISWWVADENQNAMPVLLNARQVSYPPHTEFWFEYNTSADTRTGGPMRAWGRNVVVLKDVADPTALFARPTP